MKIEEVRSKTNTELEYDLEGLKKELFELRFRNASDSSASPARINQLRRAIARIQTVMHERILGIRAQEVQ